MKKRILSLLLILCMAVTLLPTAVFAEDATGTSSAGGTIYVDAVNGNDSNENVGQSWETAYKTLETAVTAAKSGCYRSQKRRHHHAVRCKVHTLWYF